MSVTEMLLAILSICSQEELVDSESDGDEVDNLTGEDVAARRQMIKNKIMAVGRMQKVFQLLRYVLVLLSAWSVIFLICPTFDFV